jgi:hypothetical protein
MQMLTQTFASKLAITAAVAALICATPVSLDLVRAGTTGAESATHVVLAIDSAQAREARGGHGERAGGTGGRQASRDAGSNTKGNDVRANNARANDVRANNVKANDIRANNITKNDVRRNDVNVNNVRATNVNKTNVNAANVNTTNVNGAYVRPPYIGRSAAVAAGATAAAVGTTVAVLPASCTVVYVDGVTYHDCSGTYYVASDGIYAVVNPPR